MTHRLKERPSVGNKNKLTPEILMRILVGIYGEDLAVKYYEKLTKDDTDDVHNTEAKEE